MAAICRKGIVHLNEKGWSHVVVTSKMVSEYLKKERFEAEQSESIRVPGIATGLSVTRLQSLESFVTVISIELKSLLVIQISLFPAFIPAMSQ